MDIIRAKELLELLADGVNPMTGEILPEEDCCNQAEVVRALHTAVTELDKLSARVCRPQPENAGKPWTKEEDEQLVQEYQNGILTREIAKLHNRSKGAISARLVRIGLVTDSYTVK